MSLLALMHVVFSTTLLMYALTVNDAYQNAFQLFNEYVHKYNKSYKPGTMEFVRRESIFQESLKRIELLNRHRNTTAAALYGINQFSDLTPEEFEKYVHMSHMNSSVKLSTQHHAENLKRETIMKSLPQKVDWREKKVITSVRNQDKCGACWAFSTVETIEAMYALKNGVLEEWSVQQIIDCAPKPNQGCEGGDTCLAIEWLSQNKINLVLAKDYPFEDDRGLCKMRKSDKTVSVASNFTCDNFVGKEELMLYQLAHHGPLVVAVDATGWQDYLGGIIQFHCDDDRNHAVQIVGYDLTGEVPFYIVRNSWGTKFGNDGYLYVAVGKNLCGIAEEVSSLDVL